MSNFAIAAGPISWGETDDQQPAAPAQPSAFPAFTSAPWDTTNAYHPPPEPPSAFASAPPQPPPSFAAAPFASAQPEAPQIAWNVAANTPPPPPATDFVMAPTGQPFVPTPPPPPPKFEHPSAVFQPLPPSSFEKHSPTVFQPAVVPQIDACAAATATSPAFFEEEQPAQQPEGGYAVDSGDDFGDVSLQEGDSNAFFDQIGGNFDEDVDFVSSAAGAAAHAFLPAVSPPKPTVASPLVSPKLAPTFPAATAFLPPPPSPPPLPPPPPPAAAAPVENPGEKPVSPMMATVIQAPVQQQQQQHAINTAVVEEAAFGSEANPADSNDASPSLPRLSSGKLANPNLEAGRRKLEEFKRKKQAALAKKLAAAGGSAPAAAVPAVEFKSSTHVNSVRPGSAATQSLQAVPPAMMPPSPLLQTPLLDPSAAGEIAARAQAATDAALARAAAAEAAAAESSRDLERVLRQLEALDAERTGLQREKAALLGDLVAYQTAAEGAASARQELSIALGRAEVQSARAVQLEDACGAYEAQLQAAHAEKEAAVAAAEGAAQQAVQHAEELSQWIAATQADSQAVREDSARLHAELQQALKARRQQQEGESSAAAAAAAEEVAAVRAENERLQGELVQALEAQYTSNVAVQEEISALMAENEGLKAQLQALEAEMAASAAGGAVGQEELASLRVDNERLQGEVLQALEAEQGARIAAQEEVAAVRAEMGRLAAELAQAQAAQNSADAAAAAVTTGEGSLIVAEVAALRAELEAERSARAAAEDAVASARDDVASLREMLQEGEAERQGMAESLQQAQNAAQQAQQFAVASPPPPQQPVPSYIQEQTAEILMLRDAAAAADARAAAAEAERAESASREALAVAAADAARSEAEIARSEAAALQDVATRLQADLVAVERAQYSVEDSPSASRRGGEDPQTLRYRLSKAEAVVEKERRTVQALERQVKEAETAAAEGRAATAAAFELRRRCDAAEREAAAARALLQEQQEELAASERMRGGAFSAGHDMHAQVVARLRDAEARCAAVDAAATDLRAQCDAAARTISKLVDENQELCDRLNRQTAEISRLQDAAAPAAAFPAAGEPSQQTFAAPGGDEIQAQPEAAAERGGGGGVGVWSVPGARVLPVEEAARYEEELSYRAHSKELAAPPTEREDKRARGFWAWIAGADLMDD